MVNTEHTVKNYIISVYSITEIIHLIILERN